MKKIIFYGLYFLSPLYMFLVIYQSNPMAYTHSTRLAGMAIGVLAYNWFIWQFILSSRPKIIDRIVGLDQVYRLHGIMAMVSILLALVHNSLMESIYGESLMTTLGSLSLLVFIVISAISVLMVVKKRGQHLAIVKKIQSMLKVFSTIKHEHLRSFHNLSLLGLILMQVHVLMTSNAQNYTLIYIVYMVYFSLAMAIYLYHKFLRPWLLKEDPYKIVGIHKRSKDIWSIQMSGKKVLTYKPGQFGFFSFYLNGKREEHPFSFSSAKAINDTVEITVKELGDFTRNLGQLKVGDSIAIHGPFGRFTYRDQTDEKQLFLIAGGIGITPLISMLKDMSHYTPDKHVTLIWGIQSMESFVFQQELLALEKTMKHLQVVPVVSNDPHYRGETGFITRDILKKYRGLYGSTDKTDAFYICGPQILMDNTKRDLKAIGISSQRIHYEAFSF